jgi:hypothetical protein
VRRIACANDDMFARTTDHVIAKLVIGVQLRGYVCFTAYRADERRPRSVPWR